LKEKIVLGITSAAGISGAGIASDSGILAECSFSSKAVQSEKLIVLIHEVLERIKLGIKDIDAVAVTTGPGSYSGLRGGLAAAKGLVEALNIPIISVSTLEAIAFNFIDFDGTVAIAVNACKDDYNFSLWGSKKGELKRMTADITVKMNKIAEVISKVKGKMILAADKELKNVMKNDNILSAEEKNVMPWAVNVARIGLRKLRKNEIEDHITLAPTYSHKPNIREHKK
jgi:tRNA threonylcarbamoyl adenosine modification protein YeaZ